MQATKAKYVHNALLESASRNHQRLRSPKAAGSSAHSIRPCALRTYKELHRCPPQTSMIAIEHILKVCVPPPLRMCLALRSRASQPAHQGTPQFSTAELIRSSEQLSCSLSSHLLRILQSEEKVRCRRLDALCCILAHDIQKGINAFVVREFAGTTIALDYGIKFFTSLSTKRSWSRSSLGVDRYLIRPDHVVPPPAVVQHVRTGYTAVTCLGGSQFDSLKPFTLIPHQQTHWTSSTQRIVLDH